MVKNFPYCVLNKTKRLQILLFLNKTEFDVRVISEYARFTRRNIGLIIAFYSSP